MKIITLPRRTLIASVVASLGLPGMGFAAVIPFVQYPAGSAYKMPIPNVVLSVDDSGSMGTKDDGTNTRIQHVQTGLKSTLIDSTKYDNQFRIAWQSMWSCNNIPSTQADCAGKNAMGIFYGAHKSNLADWINTLAPRSNTPSHTMVWNAGEYMKTTGTNSPWNKTPGTADDKPLTCRKAYHIFLTDGGWNEYVPSSNSTYYNKYTNNIFNAFDFQSKMLSTSADAIGNADGTTATLTVDASTSKTYDPTSDQARVYADSWGSTTRDEAYAVTNNPGDGSPCSKSSNGRCIQWLQTRTFKAPTLADMAFHYWSSDLQPSIANELIPSIKHAGDETFVDGAKSTTLQEFWNPKNDPATWQHLTQYTIGYGGAYDWKLFTSNVPLKDRYGNDYFPTTSNPANAINPEFDQINLGNMYGGDFAKIVNGTRKWFDPVSEIGPREDRRAEELWHMAINSRGKFYPVKGGDLSAVFDDIFSAIVADNTKPLTSFTSAAGSVSRVGTSSYQSGYVSADDVNSNANRWYGFVASNTLASSGAQTPNAAWGLTADGKNVTTADKLDALSTTDIANRLVMSFNDSTKTGVSFEWGATVPLSDTQKTLMNVGNIALPFGTTNGDNKGQDRVNYIRGDRTKEADKTGGTFRIRKSRQGDIVNSQVWYTGAPVSGFALNSYRTFAGTHKTRIPMIYVGGNDGMLHGFSAVDGAEKIAYVPQGVIANLPAYTNVTYDHKYYVDGSPFSGDVKLGSAGTADDWSTYLVGTLGAGGKGFFILDVTRPGSTDTAGVATNFSKANASSLVVMDKTAYNASATDTNWANSWKDVGYIFSSPTVAENNSQRVLQLTRTNDGRSALIIGNGYNSTNERPALLIQYLDGSKEMKVIPAVPLIDPVTNAQHADAVANGLSAPQFLDVNGDTIPDFVYAGDLRGNLWKFDISSEDSAAWGVAFSGKPLFTATYTSPSNSVSRQPITVAPVLRPNRVAGGLNVAFGTGRNLTETDRTDQSKQTVYSILDNTRYELKTSGTGKGKVNVKASDPTPTPVSGRASLQSQSVDTDSKANGAGVSTGRSFWKLNTTEVKYVCASTDTGCAEKKGWYLDLPDTGERVLSPIAFYDGGNTLEIRSQVPASGGSTASDDETCSPQPTAAKNYRTLMNIASGMPAKAPLMNVNGDVDTATGYGIYSGSDAGYARSTSSGAELSVENKEEQIRIGADGITDKYAKAPRLLLRPNWRQLK